MILIGKPPKSPAKGRTMPSVTRNPLGRLGQMDGNKRLVTLLWQAASA